MIVGVLGGGQLGMMLAEAGAPLGMRFRFLDPAREAPAAHLGEMIRAEFTDLDAVRRLCDGADVVTFEFENVPAATVEEAARHAPVWPPGAALAVAQDRLNEKRLFERLGIATTVFADVTDEASLSSAAERVGFPSVLKTRRMGYDGKGQAVVRRREELAPAWERLGKRPSILESFQPFEREVSIIGVRGRGGDAVFYPLVENAHRAGILRLSTAPIEDGAAGALQAEAERAARGVLDALGYVGAMAIEFFVVGGKLIANEIAPRVHNSGHWTIEGAECSQFENHLRAVAGLPLGSTAARGWSAMLNIIGAAPAREIFQSAPDAHLHMYGKSEAPGRKIGHVTIVAPTAAERARRVEALRSALGAAGVVGTDEASVG